MVEELDRVVVVLWGRWRQEFQANNSAKADEIDKKIDEIEAKREKAKKELEEAKKELKEADQKYEAKASVQAGRGQAGASAFAVVAVAFGLQHSRVCFRAVHRCCFLGSCSPLSKDSPVVKLHCFGLQHFGEREGLLAASGFTQIWLPFAFCRRFRTGCQS